MSRATFTKIESPTLPKSHPLHTVYAARVGNTEFRIARDGKGWCVDLYEPIMGVWERASKTFPTLTAAKAAFKHETSKLRRNPEGATAKSGSFKTMRGDTGLTDVAGYVSDNGVWGIYEGTGGGLLGVSKRWMLIHIPTGLMFPIPDERYTLADLKNLLVVMPEALYSAATKEKVMEVGPDFASDLRKRRVTFAVRKSKREAPARSADHDLRIREHILDAGLRSLGQYYGRRGDYYGFRDATQRGSASVYAISVGARDVSLQRRIIEANGDMRWIMDDTELKSRVTPEQLDGWIATVKAAESAASVKQARRARPNTRRRNPPEAKVKAGSFTAKVRERTSDGWRDTKATLDGYLSDNGLWFIHKAVKGGPLGLNNAWVLMYTPNSGLWPFNEPQTSVSIKKLLAEMPPELYNAADPMDMQDYASDFLHSRRRNPAHEGDREQRIAAIHTAQTARGPRYTVHFGYARWVKGEFTAAKARKASQTFTSRAKADAASDKWIAKGV